MEKVRGGVQVEWIGYLLDPSRLKIGITESRAAWAVRWLTDKAAWASGGPRFARPLLPAMILIIMDFLAEQLRGSRSSGCREATKDQGELFRLDATAAGHEVAIGGWLSQGGRPCKEAPLLRSL